MNDLLQRAHAQARAELNLYERQHAEVINRWQWLKAKVKATKKDLQQRLSEERDE